jgi:hypothetical protein
VEETEVKNEESIATLLSKHLESNDPTIVAAALQKLSNLCTVEDEDEQETEKKNAEEIISLGGHAVILNAMRRYSTSRDVQANACDVLGNLSCYCHAVQMIQLV